MPNSEKLGKSKATLTMTNDDQASVKIPLKRFYVYALIDPRETLLTEPDRGVFYIGKGQRKRLWAHVNNAKSSSNSTDAGVLDDESLIEQDNNDAIDEDANESSKNQRIIEIQDAGYEVVERVLGRFDTEEESFAVEAILIHWVYGRLQEGGKLTNIQAGHHHLHFRNRGDMEQRERLDVSKNMRSDPGVYSSNALKRLVDNNIKNIADETVDDLRSLLSEIQERYSDIKIGDAHITDSGRYVCAVVDLGDPDVILRLQFTPNTLITNLRARNENNKTGRKAFAARMLSVGLLAIGNDHYGWIGDWMGNGLRFNDYPNILHRIEKACSMFASAQPKLPPA